MRTAAPGHVGVRNLTWGRLNFATLGFIALFALALVAGTQSAIAERGQGGMLRLLFWQAPTVVNPHLSIGNKDLTASRIVYEPLASFDKDGLP